MVVDEHLKKFIYKLILNFCFLSCPAISFVLQHFSFFIIFFLNQIMNPKLGYWAFYFSKNQLLQKWSFRNKGEKREVNITKEKDCYEFRLKGKILLLCWSRHSILYIFFIFIGPTPLFFFEKQKAKFCCERAVTKIFHFHWSYPTLLLWKRKSQILLRKSSYKDSLCCLMNIRRLNLVLAWHKLLIYIESITKIFECKNFFFLNLKKCINVYWIFFSFPFTN